MFKEAILSSPIILMFKFHTWLRSREMAETWHPFGDPPGTGAPRAAPEHGALACPGEELLGREIPGLFCNAFPKTPAGSHKPPQ